MIVPLLLDGTVLAKRGEEHDLYYVGTTLLDWVRYVVPPRPPEQRAAFCTCCLQAEGENRQRLSFLAITRILINPFLT
jgi:hypothetical protein